MITRIIWTFKNNESSLRPRVTNPTRGTLAPPQHMRRAPLFDATAERWIVPPSTVTVETGAAAELRHIHNAAHKRPAVVPQTQAAGRLHAVVDGVVVALGMTMLCLVAGVLLVIA